jgi:hypothetical protein
MLTAILSITAIVISCVSLAWQVVTWRQSGPVITVTVSQAMPTYGPGMGTSVGEPHVCVTAANSGRSPITVKNWGLKLADGRTLAMRGTSWSAALPCRLEPGADASWYVETKSVTESCAANGIRYQDLLAYVSLADGQTIKAREPGIRWK